jgi:hypothetical protein
MQHEIRLLIAWGGFFSGHRCECLACFIENVRLHGQWMGFLPCIGFQGSRRVGKQLLMERLLKHNFPKLTISVTGTLSKEICAVLSMECSWL